MKKQYSYLELEQVLNEVKLLELLIENHGKNLRYCPESKTFFVFDDVRWHPSTDNVRVRLMLKDTLDKYLDEHMSRCADDWQKIKLQKFFNRCGKGNSAKRIFANVEIFKEVHLPKEQFDRKPALLAVPNGTIDLTTGQLRESLATDYISRMCKTPYFPEKDCPQFKQFILDIANGSKELATHILMILAYCLTGLSTEQKVYIFYGLGANGKSVLLELFRKIIGSELVVHADSKTLVKNGRAIREDIARFEGARLATCSEIGIQDTLDEPLIKGLSGGDKMVSRRLYQNSQEFQNSAKIIIATNILPNIEATDRGIERRLEVIPFNQTFTGDRMDKNMMAKLLEESEGILALLVQHATAYFIEGEIRPSEVSVKTTEGYIKSGNSVKCFLEECTQKTIVSGSELTLQSMYQEYVAYCPKNGQKTSSMHDFSRLMKLHGKEQRKSGSCRYWIGLTIKPILTDPVPPSDEKSVSLGTTQQEAATESGGSMNVINDEMTCDLGKIPEVGVDMNNFLRTLNEANIRDLQTM